MNQKVVRVRDLGLAAALASSGFEVWNTDRDESGRAFFVFLHSADLDRAVKHYWDDTLNVKARKYFDNTKMLKSRIYAEG